MKYIIVLIYSNIVCVFISMWCMMYILRFMIKEYLKVLDNINKN